MKWIEDFHIPYLNLGLIIFYFLFFEDWNSLENNIALSFDFKTMCSLNYPVDKDTESCYSLGIIHVFRHCFVKRR